VKLVSFANGVQQGEIACSAANGAVTATAPPTFNTALPVKVFTHGFSPLPGSSQPLKTEFAVRWNAAYGGKVNVVLVNWYALSTAFQVDLVKFNAAYDTAAQNAMRVGTVVGACLAALFQQRNIPLRNLHLVGHSLGGQAMGQAGRTITLLTQVERNQFSTKDDIHLIKFHLSRS
jgi:pimeloyl-ACP methyl ester carboxylesterase